MKYILSIDIGTTAVKGAVIGEDGALYGHCTSEYTLITLPTGEVEQSIEVYEKAFREAVRGAVKNAGAAAEDIKCLGFSATGETVVFMDEKGRALRNVMAWMDTRALAEAEYLTSLHLRDEILRKTGAASFRPSFLASKVLWVKRNEPEIFAASAKIGLIKDYFLLKLTGRFVSEDSLMCDAGYWEIPSRRYWPEVLKEIGIGEERLPEVVWPGEELGCITAEAAEEYGLCPETKINAGGMDQACGAIGAGNIRPGIVSESTGSALVSVFISDRYAYDPTGGIPLFSAGLPGQYMFQPFSTGAIVMKWFRDQFCEQEKQIEQAGGPNAYTLIDNEVAATAPGNDGLILLPYFQGSGSPVTNKRAKGVYYGITASHTRGHFARAIMEGLAMALRHMVTSTEPLSGRATEIRSLGGGAKSRIWCQIKADVLGIPVKVIAQSESAPCMGAAILAGVANGIWPSVEEAVDRFVSFSEVYFPREENRAVYDSAFEKYLEISLTLNGTF